VLQACIIQNPSTAERPDLTAILTSFPSRTITPQPTLDLFPIYTQPSTLTPNGERKMFELLQSKECKLPCYLGIIPGKTSAKEAVAILENLGAYFSGSLENRHSYSLNIGDPTIPTSPPNRSALVSDSISLTVAGDIVQIVHVGILVEKTTASLELYREYWSRYSTSNMFAELGKPNHLYVAIDYDKKHNSELTVDYEELGILVRIRGTRQENNLCTIDEDQEILVTMDLFDPSSGLTAKDFNSHLNTPPYWPPINEALGITVDEFYEAVVENPSICFEPKAANP
jgi:hypothetical protein